MVMLFHLKGVFIMVGKRKLVIAILILVATYFSGCALSNEETNSISENVTTKATIQKQTTETSEETSETTTIVNTGTYLVEPVKANEPTMSARKMPDMILEQIRHWEKVYPHMTIGVGLYSLDGTHGYVYNTEQMFNSACTIKAAFGKYVLQTCEEKGIDIWSTYITFQKRHDDPEGSGDITKYGNYGEDYSIGYLVNVLLGVSDNVAYTMLLDMFPLNDFSGYLRSIGGQNDGMKWGSASVSQRKNEWLDIYKYITSGSLYSETLRQDLRNTPYAYIPEGMTQSHNYLHKSGWTEESPNYPAAADCCIIDDEYLLIIMTEDSTAGSGHIDAIQYVANLVEAFYYQSSGYMF